MNTLVRRPLFVVVFALVGIAAPTRAQYTCEQWAPLATIGSPPKRFGPQSPPYQDNFFAFTPDAIGPLVFQWQRIVERHAGRPARQHAHARHDGPAARDRPAVFERQRAVLR